ncbi:hypothetical protein TBLA_0D02120 [Henningerozyma blattae CBS 6284]|uniref:Attractin/MKLN-like beta-propeller domain-containing protein n=1 Tax=Henningerozyma blattae (strain ATCC 34711 / CBS 6284 / DSM 70876 / NBRC 10599 / NRRL Y-10934 / UCD 77-7) TaxID=1071380 RepID=I2H2W6_HENB6|nr:hypothetical protein TBLA_0D02120 [Tetrapisispora blattae CBS 6284]CCH60718.1 hypothetical protein TBLA_0D02120 [Tetrapisispora blattae CBS 6284]
MQSILQPSKCKCYDLTLPDINDNTDVDINKLTDLEKAKLTLNLRTGAAVNLFRSNFFVNGGLTIPLNLKEYTLKQIYQELIRYFSIKKTAEKNSRANSNKRKNSSTIQLYQDDDYYNIDIIPDLHSYISSETFNLDLVERTWVRVSTTVVNNSENTGPFFKPRILHTICYTNAYLYLFGGLTISDGDPKILVPSNELWKLNLQTKKWSLVAKDSNIPARFSHTMVVKYEDDDSHDTKLVIIGGLTHYDVPLFHIDCFNLVSDKWEYPETNTSNLVNIDHKPVSLINGKTFIEIVQDNKANVPTIVFYKPLETAEDNDSLIDKYLAPFAAQPIITNSKGMRLDVKFEQFGSVRKIPYQLQMPMGASFVNNIVLAGYFKNYNMKNFHCLCYNIQSKKYIKLNINCPAITKHQHRYWKLFIWKSHQQLIFFGSKYIDKYLPSVQKFDHILVSNLPIANIYNLSSNFNCRTNNILQQKLPLTSLESFSNPNYNNFTLSTNTSNTNSNELNYRSTSFTNVEIPNLNYGTTTRSSSTTSNISNTENHKKYEFSQFENYVKYMTPSTDYSSLGAVFPTYSMVLGKDLMEIFGQSVSDFSFKSLDGDLIPIPIYLLRKRWGRYFDMLFAHSYNEVLKDYDNNDESNFISSSASILTSNIDTSNSSPKFSLLSSHSNPDLLSCEKARPRSRGVSITSSNYSNRDSFSSTSNPRSMRNSLIMSSYSPRKASIDSYHYSTASNNLAVPTSNNSNSNNSNNGNNNNSSTFSSPIRNPSLSKLNAIANMPNISPKSTIANTNIPTTMPNIPTSLSMSTPTTVNTLFRSPFKSKHEANDIDYDDELAKDLKNNRKDSAHSPFHNANDDIHLKQKNLLQSQNPTLLKIGDQEYEIPSRIPSPDLALPNIPILDDSLTTNPTSVNYNSNSHNNAMPLNMPANDDTSIPIPLTKFAFSHIWQERQRRGSLPEASITSKLAQSNKKQPAENIKYFDTSSNQLPQSGSRARYNSEPTNIINEDKNKNNNNYLNNISNHYNIPNCNSPFPPNIQTHKMFYCNRLSTSTTLSTEPPFAPGDMDSVLIPRVLYMPWCTATIKSFAEFFFTGQINPKWELAPVILNLLVISKIYKVPLLYALVQEALYTIIKKKENHLKTVVKSKMRQYQTLLKDIKNEADKRLLKDFLTHNTNYNILVDLERILRDNETGFFDASIVQKIIPTLASTSESVDLSHIKSTDEILSHPNDKNYNTDNNFSHPHTQGKYVEPFLDDSLELIAISNRSKLRSTNLNELKNETVSGASLFDENFGFTKEKELYFHEEDFIIEESSMSESSDIELGGFSLSKIKREVTKKDPDDDSGIACSSKGKPSTSKLNGSNFDIFSNGSAGSNDDDSIDPLTKEDFEIFKPNNKDSNKKPGLFGDHYEKALTLEQLTSSTTLPPVDYIIKSIFRCSALVDDPILTIRCLACLEVSTTLNTISQRTDNDLAIVQSQIDSLYTIQ